MKLIYAAILLLSMKTSVCKKWKSLEQSRMHSTVVARHTNPKYARQQVLENQSIEIRGMSCVRAQLTKPLI
ncbi:hypothetical protein DFH08DRAFT_832374 [Mycena albidolilacea]|uniref:Secreted protein n=1 Tax=Mycena albidolilacea TaxID=1033008 RepID=A0AAD7F7L2_9AGAR|nr:hypothetical protein DFH08DRAFT_832374 [Mycena albidolilacea]